MEKLPCDNLPCDMSLPSITGTQYVDVGVLHQQRLKQVNTMEYAGNSVPIYITGPHREVALFILSWFYRILSRFVGTHITMAKSLSPYMRLWANKSR